MVVFMALKDLILEILELNRNNYISGERLATTFSVTRAGVNRAIKSLQAEGYEIVAVNNCGYCLTNKNDLLSTVGIRQYLHPEYKYFHISIYKEVGSTNDEAKNLATTGGVEGTIVIAEKQLAGRGRYGRNFFSPAGTGIYMSIILRPRLQIQDISLITVQAAVAICRALEKFSSNKLQIKWVNDIFFNNKKVCGVLSEAVTEFESQIVESLVVGIGINVKTKDEDFPKELQSSVSSLFIENVTRNQIIASIVNELFVLYRNSDNINLIDEYKERLLLLNREITFKRNNVSYRGTVLDVSYDGSLVVRLTDEKIITLKSGEVTIGSNNYEGA